MASQEPKSRTESPDTRIALADALPGMKLGQPLLDAAGILLLPAGTALTPGILESLRHHQIETVAVLGLDAAENHDTPDNDRTQAERAQALARVDRLFRQPATSAATQTLYRYVCAFRASATA